MLRLEITVQLHIYTELISTLFNMSNDERETIQNNSTTHETADRTVTD